MPLRPHALGRSAVVPLVAVLAAAASVVLHDGARPATDEVTPTAVVSAPTVTKALVFVEENHSLSQMQSGMPYTFSIAKQFGYASNWSAVTHPSLPNYLAIAGGSTFGVTDDNTPSAHPINAQTVFGQALARGKTAKSYLDGMPSNCYPVAGGTKYAVKHNPWAYFTPTAEHSGCTSYDVPESRLSSDITNGTLPNVGLVVPNLCNDAHDCSLSTADGWFKTRMQAIMAGPDWKAGRLAVILTADEDDRNSGNKVLTMVAHPSQQNNVVSTGLTHYSLTRFLEDVVGASHLRNASTAPNMATAFGLPMPDWSSSSLTDPSPTPTPAPTTTSGVGFATAKSGSAIASTLNVAVPATSAGQTTVLSIATRGRPSVTAPSGWKLVRSDASDTLQRQSIYVKTSSAATSATTARFTLSAVRSAAWTASVYNGVDPTTPVADSAVSINGSRSTTRTVPAVSTPSGGRTVAFTGLANDCTVTPASGWSERGLSSVTTDFKLTAELADVAGTPTGSAGPTSNPSTQSIVTALALNPA